MILQTSLFSSDYLYLSRWELIKLFVLGELRQKWCALVVRVGRPL
jgi:hypothetical protein